MLFVVLLQLLGLWVPAVEGYYYYYSYGSNEQQEPQSVGDCLAFYASGGALLGLGVVVVGIGCLNAKKNIKCAQCAMVFGKWGLLVLLTCFFFFGGRWCGLLAHYAGWLKG